MRNDLAKRVNDKFSAGGGWVEIISSNEQMRISRQGVVKQEYSKREDEMFSSGG